MSRHSNFETHEIWTQESERLYVVRFKPHLNPDEWLKIHSDPDFRVIEWRFMRDGSQAVAYDKQAFGMSEAERRSTFDDYAADGIPRLLGNISMVNGVAIGELNDL